MKKTSILSAILAGSLMVFGGFGCSQSDKPPPAAPNTVTGQVSPSGEQQTTPPSTATTPQTTTPGSQGYQTTTPNTGYQTTTPGTETTPGSTGTYDQRQPVKGSTTTPDTTKPDMTNPDNTQQQQQQPGSTIPPKQ